LCSVIAAMSNPVIIACSCADRRAHVDVTADHDAPVRETVPEPEVLVTQQMKGDRG